MVEGKKISELNAVDNLNYGSCFPVLINGATKKITFSNLLNDIISNLGNLNKEEISELQKKIKEHESRIEVSEKDIVIIEKTISDLQQKDTEQDDTITKYILLFEEMKNIYEQAVISGGIVDSELNVNSVNAIQNKAVAKLIPAQTSEENQLADKNFVNSSIQTETANFRGNWETFDDIPTDAENYPADYVGNKKPNVNDYLVVRDYNGEGTWRFKYIGKWEEVGKNGWKEEYQVNEKPFTSEQLASINSGITEQKVARYDGMTFPVGTILSGLYATAPTGFLLCNGQEVAIADYFELYTVIGALAECQSENEGMFKLPDLREVTLVGAGQNEKLSITAHDVYNVGEFKDDQMQGHKHNDSGHDHNLLASSIAGSIDVWGLNFYPRGTPFSDERNVLGAKADKNYANLGLPTKYSDDYGTPRTGKTTHGKQLGVNYIIKY